MGGALGIINRGATNLDDILLSPMGESVPNIPSRKECERIK
jgi:hypothetical protein